MVLDAGNTYYAGEPVKFNITGEIDNLVFYSGENGHRYEYRNRFEVPLENVVNATLHMDFQARNGAANALEIYLSFSSFYCFTLPQRILNKQPVDT